MRSRTARTTGGRLSSPVVTAILLILVAVLGLLLLNALHVINLFPTRTDPAVLEETTRFALRDLGELATQEALMTRVHSMSDSRQLFGITWPGTRRVLIFSYDISVRAGLDFGQVAFEADPQARTVTVTLPAARVLEASVVPDSYQVYEESGNKFNAWHSEDFAGAMDTMLREGREYAVAQGILDKARDNAETLIRGFLASAYPAGEYTYIFNWPGEGG